MEIVLPFGFRPPGVGQFGGTARQPYYAPVILKDVISPSLGVRSGMRRALFNVDLFCVH